jgi:hypothetical protein
MYFCPSNLASIPLTGSRVVYDELLLDAVGVGLKENRVLRLPHVEGLQTFVGDGVRVGEHQSVHAGDGRNQHVDRVGRLLDRDSFQDGRVLESEPDVVVDQVDVQAVLDQLQYVMAYTPAKLKTELASVLGAGHRRDNEPVNESVARVRQGCVFVSESSGSLRHFDVLKSALGTACG